MAALVLALISLAALFAALFALVLGGMNLYQAITGNRLSKKPSTRSDAVMRRQSAIAGTILVMMSSALLTIVLRSAQASL